MAPGLQGRLGGITTVRLRISGRVQGVWYRGWTVGKAQDLGLAGWVRNITDGSVEVLVNGPQEQVDRLIALCRKGPPAARVDDVDLAVIDRTGKGGAFPSNAFQQLSTHNPADLPEMK
jgi:acylphosphatase